MARQDPTPNRLVVVEDEPDIGALLEYVLGREGFLVDLVRTGQNALNALAAEPADLVVLDLMLPDMSGLDVLRRIRREEADRPRVIILSAKGDEADRIKGFELGADDYMAKPFSPQELVLRIRTALRRDRVSDAAPAARRTVAGPIEIDVERHETRVAGSFVTLTLTEFRLLEDMVRNQGRVRTRDALMSDIWGYHSEAMSRTIDTHVRRLRKKLGPAAPWLATVRGLGYRITDPGSERRDTVPQLQQNNEQVARKWSDKSFPSGVNP